MSKIGRYSADRKKVEALGTASRTLAVHDCGTVFTMDGDEALTVTLPTVAVAGKGWWAKFILTDEGTGTTVFTFPSAAASIHCNSSTGGDVNGLNSDGAFKTTINYNANDTGTLGDQIEVLCDGTYYHVLVNMDADNGITIA